MKSSIKKLGVATGVFLIATAMSPAFNSSHAILQNLGSTTVEASSSVTYTTKANLNLRSGASSSKKVLVTIPKGKEVTYILKTGSWSKVKYGSKTGYVSSSYIQKATEKKTIAKKTADKATSTASVIKYKTKTSLNLRSGASTKYKTLVTIPKNKEVTYVSKSGSWYKVKYGSKTGYVSSSYLTKVATKAPAPKVTKTASPVKTYTVTANLNLRTGASIKSSSLLTIPKGKMVTYVSKSGSWSKVKYGSKTGYVSTKYLKVTKVAVKPVVKPAPKPKPVVKPAPKPVVKPAPKPVTPTKDAFLSKTNYDKHIMSAISTKGTGEKLFKKEGSAYFATLLPSTDPALSARYNAVFVYEDSNKLVSLMVNSKVYRDNEYHRVEANKAILVATEAFFGVNKTGSKEMHAFIMKNLNATTDSEKKMTFGGNQATVRVSKWDIDIRFE